MEPGRGRWSDEGCEEEEGWAAAEGEEALAESEATEAATPPSTLVSPQLGSGRGVPATTGNGG